MTDTQKFISTLEMPEKVTLFKELYSELSGYGVEGDTELAHVNTFEAKLLKSFGGSGTINEVTGLLEYKGGGGSPPPPPSSQTVSQTSEFPTEIKPFIKDILEEGKGEFQREKEEGYLRFPGSQLAQFTPEQQAVFQTGRQQFTGLAGTPLGQASTYYTPALAATALGTSEIGTGDIQRRMDPFIQNVVDVAKREARRDEEVAQQQRAAQAVGAGSFGGSRQAIVEAEAERNLGERLGDIQARGLSTAFQNAQRAAEAQRAREMTGGRQFAGLGDATGARARSDLAGLASIGETQQQRQQQALDIARREFEEEKAFPQTALQRYASIIRGFPLNPSQQIVTTTRERPPSFASQLTGAGLGAAGTYGLFGGFSNAGGLVGLAEGGAVQPQEGVTSGNKAGSGGGGKAGGDNRYLKLLMMNPEIAKQLKDKFGLTIDSSGNWSRAVNQVAQQTQQPFANVNLGNYIKTKSDGGLLSVVRARIGKTLSNKLDPQYKTTELFSPEFMEEYASKDSPEAEPVVIPEVPNVEPEPSAYDQFAKAQINLLEKMRASQGLLETDIAATEKSINELLKDSPKKTKAAEQKEIRDFYLKEQQLAEENKKKIGERYGGDIAMAALTAAPHFFTHGKDFGEQAVDATGAAMPLVGQARSDRRTAEDAATQAAQDRRLAQRGEEKLIDDTVWEDRLKRIQVSKSITNDKFKLAQLNKEEAAVLAEWEKYKTERLRQEELRYGIGNIDLGDPGSLMADTAKGAYGEITFAKDKKRIGDIVLQAQNNIKNKYLGPDALPILSPALTLIEVQNEIRRLIRLEEEPDPDGGNKGGDQGGDKGADPLSPTAIDALNTQLD